MESQITRKVPLGCREQLLAKISIMLVPALLAVTAHEVAHGYVAERLGDPTARLLGRLTFNPIKHLDPIGTLALLFFGFGWAKPVPVNFRNLRRPRKDMMLVALAGPVTNFSLAIFSAMVLKGTVLLSGLSASGSMDLLPFLKPVALMAGFSLYINVILGVFNLFPLPPLDGGRVMTGLLPPRQAQIFERLEPFGFLIIIVLIFYTGLWGMVIGPAVSLIVRLLAGPQWVIVENAMHFLFSR